MTGYLLAFPEPKWLFDMLLLPIHIWIEFQKGEQYEIELQMKNSLKNYRPENLTTFITASKKGWWQDNIKKSIKNGT